MTLAASVVVVAVAVPATFTVVWLLLFLRWCCYILSCSRFLSVSVNFYLNSIFAMIGLYLVQVFT